MSKENYYANDGGYFFADDFRGQVLADEVDEIFSAEDPTEYMDKRFDLIHIEDAYNEMPRPLTMKDKTIGTLVVAAFIISASFAADTFICQLFDSLRNLH